MTFGNTALLMVLLCPQRKPGFPVRCRLCTEHGYYNSAPDFIYRGAKKNWMAAGARVLGVWALPRHQSDCLLVFRSAGHQLRQAV